MDTFAILVLLLLTIYTLGFAVTLWAEKQKMSALVVFFLVLIIMVLPFFSIFKN